MKRKGIVPATLCVISLVFIFGIIPAQTKTLHVPGDLEPSVFPTAAMAVVAVLSGVIFLKEQRGTETESGKAVFCLEDFKLLLLVAVLLGAYIFLIGKIGYYSVTAVSMVGMLRCYDRMSLPRCIVGAGIFLIFCYLLFEVGLRITLPQGILI